MSLAQLTGHGSFTFKLGGQTFRGAAVPLKHYFSWRELQGRIGSPEHLAWYAPLLAERWQKGKVPVTIDEDWVAQHVRLQHLPALNDALLEEIDPGQAFDTEGRLIMLGKVKILAASYTLAESHDYLELYRLHGVTLGTEDGQDAEEKREQELPMDVRLTEMARALRVRARGSIDPLIIDEDWVVEHLSTPAFRSLETLFATGRLPGDPVPTPPTSDPKG